MRPFLRLVDEQKSCAIWMYIFLAITLKQAGGGFAQELT